MPEKNIKDFIKQQLRNGVDVQTVIASALGQGWSHDEILKALSSATDKGGDKITGEPRSKQFLPISLGVVIVIAALGTMGWLAWKTVFPETNTSPVATDTTPSPTKENPTPSATATYQPVTVDITPSAKTYTLPLSENAISNLSQFDISDKTKQMLVRQGFSARPTQLNNISAIYTANKNAGRPNFITIDSLSHVFHVLFNNSLNYIETKKIVPELTNLNKTLLASAQQQYEATDNVDLKNSAKKNLAFFAVANKLLEPQTPTPPDVQDMVSEELSLIEKHAGIHNSPIFGYREDYSQYTPYGHYTRSENLQRYFQAKSWYERMMFSANLPEETKATREENYRAILIALSLRDSKVQQEEALKTWDHIHRSVSFFTGETDSLSVQEYISYINEVFGENPELTDLTDTVKIDQLIAKVKQAKVSNTNPLQSTKLFSLLGHRFTPDSYIFQQLTFPLVETYSGSGAKPYTSEMVTGGHTVRAFPLGLDVATVLGSTNAKEHLDKQRDSKYKQYDDQLKRLVQIFSTLPNQQWTQNLFWARLSSLQPLLISKKSGYPIYMQQPAWADKDLNTFLGSWTELRHDATSRAKQLYIGKDKQAPPNRQTSVPRGHVEASPEAYARLIALTIFMKQGLEANQVLTDEDRVKIDRFEEVLRTVKTIAEKELTNQELSIEDHEFIKDFGNTLEEIIIYSINTSPQAALETDRKMLITTELHNDRNNQKVMQAAIGNPLELLVVTGSGQNLELSSGPIYSYYEFKQATNQQLTDELWQQMSNKPSLPPFTKSFVSLPTP